MIDRRSVLVGLGGVSVLGAAAACTGSGGGRAATATASSTTGASPVPTRTVAKGKAHYTGDLRVAALAAAMENLAVSAHATLLEAVQTGRLGSRPAALATFATAAMKQHKAHAGTWNDILGQADLPRIGTPALTIANERLAALRAAGSLVELVKLAIAFEQIAASTYTFVVGNVTAAGTIAAAARIAPVEAMHAAVLAFMLGDDPVPDTYIPTERTLTADMFTG